MCAYCLKRLRPCSLCREGGLRNMLNCYFLYKKNQKKKHFKCPFRCEMTRTSKDVVPTPNVLYGRAAAPGLEGLLSGFLFEAPGPGHPGFCGFPSRSKSRNIQIPHANPHSGGGHAWNTMCVYMCTYVAKTTPHGITALFKFVSHVLYNLNNLTFYFCAYLKWKVPSCLHHFGLT